ncbi:MAG: hypothetical protein OXF41_02655 [bacterium]|nr:hypothetical protein [bacterium]
MPPTTTRRLTGEAWEGLERLGGPVGNRGWGRWRGFRGGSAGRVKPVSRRTQAAGAILVWSGVLTWEFVWVRRPPRSGIPGSAAVQWLEIREGGWVCDEGGVMVRGVGFFGNW